ncbi:hypothetical protein [Streptomyces afghaniensis]|uniref:hypothetical protein n=1 Tax=Streptomyces afghaniensis TaxID=66865 RepID=UPI003F4BE9F9
MSSPFTRHGTEAEETDDDTAPDFPAIAAEDPGEVYFRDGDRRAHGLEVEFTDSEHLEFDL